MSVSKTITEKFLNRFKMTVNNRNKRSNNLNLTSEIKKLMNKTKARSFSWIQM